MALLAVTLIFSFLDFSFATPVVVSRATKTSNIRPFVSSCDLLVDNCLRSRTLSPEKLLQLICENAVICPMLADEDGVSVEVYSQIAGTCATRDQACSISLVNSIPPPFTQQIGGMVFLCEIYRGIRPAIGGLSQHPWPSLDDSSFAARNFLEVVKDTLCIDPRKLDHLVALQGKGPNIYGKDERNNIQSSPVVQSLTHTSRASETHLPSATVRNETASLNPSVVSGPTSSHTSNAPLVTSIPFNTNPIPPKSARSETFIAPGITTVIPIPTASTIIGLGPVSEVPKTLKSTSISSGSSGVVSSVEIITAIPTVLGITVGPGGGVIGTIPTSVSQPGVVPPIFNTNPIPEPSATEFLFRTFTGSSGYITVIPMPTAPVTIEIGADFGGGEIQLGLGGLVVGTLPPGIEEVGGVSPVPGPEPGETNNPITSSPTMSSSAKSSSTASSSGSSSSCGLQPASTCGIACAVKTDDASSSSPTSTATSKVSLGKRGVRELSAGCRGGPTRNSPVNGTRYVLSGSMTQPTHKPDDFKTEHVFEFQLFSQFINEFINDRRNSDLKGCTGSWLKTFYLSNEIGEVITSIDNKDNMANNTSGFIETSAFADGFINTGKQYTCIALDRSTAMLEKQPGIDINTNARIFQNTVTAIIGKLQNYDRRVGSTQSPPIAIQFYEYMQADVVRYAPHAKALALRLANEFGDLNRRRPIQCLQKPWIQTQWQQVELALNNNFPTLNTGALLPPRPLCFPNGSPGILDFRPSPYTQSTGLATTPVTVKNAQANGLNTRVEIQATAGKLFWPIPLTTPIECNGIYTVRASSTFAPTPVPFGLDCTSREVSIVALNPQVCAFFETGIKKGTQLCGTALTDVLRCGAARFPNAPPMANKMFWHPIPG
ncbi:hypothetical protein DFH09DRAFT_1102466 [Mycena vulgaris]|nr:hypothetical protein DFH09DRAFT_1102466 [Mycena vulgaris]